MIVLGINHSNDAAASIVKDGVVLAASREERFTRKKHESGFPHQAIDFCLKKAGVTLPEVDHVAFFWNPGIHAQSYNGRKSDRWSHHLEFLYSVPNHLLRHYDGDPVEHVEQVIQTGSGRTLRIHYVSHHLCHAAAAFFRSPFDDAAILTVDGYGERRSTHIAVGEGLELRTIHDVEFPHSVGSLYAAFTQYLGFRANNGEGKVMGLASYGSDSCYEKIRRLVTLTEDGFELDLSYFRFYVERERRYSSKLVELLGPERNANDPMEARHYDIAYGLQKTTEDILLHLAEVTRQKTGKTRLAMAGGVVLNCVANSRIAFDSSFEDTFFLPAAGDDGTSMGAALYVSHVLNHVPKDTATVFTDYLGLSYTQQEVEAELKKAGLRWETCSDTPARAAHMLAQGKIIGWFQGAAEFGPRALGNRSILADPRRPEMKDILNARVKFREPFRPFAPSCLEEACGDLFDQGDPSPFMLRVYQTRQDRLHEMGSVTHVDGGARVQTVTPQSNERYYKLIEAFGKETGVSCVLNTSFNIRGEPIVNSVTDAVKCFFTTDLDALFIGDCLLFKENQGSAS